MDHMVEVNPICLHMGRRECSLVLYQHNASRCTISEGYVFVAFGDAQVDLALAEIKRVSPFLAESKPLNKCSS